MVGHDLPKMPYYTKDHEECFQYCKDYLEDEGKFCAGMSFNVPYDHCWLHDNIYDNKIEYRYNHYFARNEPCQPSKFQSLIK